MIKTLLQKVADQLGLNFAHGLRGEIEQQLNKLGFEQDVLALYTPPASETTFDELTLSALYTQYTVQGLLLCRAEDLTDPEEVSAINARLRSVGVELYRQAMHTTLRPAAQYNLVSGVSFEDARTQGVPSTKQIGLYFSFQIRLKQGFNCELLDCPPLNLVTDC